MISLKSLYNFFYINGLLVTMGTVQYLTINYSNNIVFKFAITFLDFSFRNYFFVKFIDYNLRNREKIKNDVTKEEYKNEFVLAFLSSTLVETVTYIIITALLFHNSQINYFYDCIKDNNVNYELNHKLSLEFFIDDILFILIYKKKYKKEILKLIKILPKTYKHIKKNIHYERISIIQVSKWYIRPERNRK